MKLSIASLLAFIGLVLVILLGWYVDRVAGSQLATSIQFVIRAGALTIATALVIGLVAWGYIAIERSRIESERRLEVQAGRHVREVEVLQQLAVVRKTMAEARKIEREAAVFATVTKPGELLHITHAGKITTHTVIPTLSGSSHSNGHPTPPTEAELQRWYFFHSLGAAAPQTALPSGAEPVYLPSPTLPEEVPLLDYLGGGASLEQVFLGLGRFPDGQVKPVRMPLRRLTHVAVAGTSGFGKSVALQCLAYQLLHAREAAQVTLLDTQGTTFTRFDGHPQLRFPVVSREGDIMRVLQALYGEMERRDELFTQWRGIENLVQYNQVAQEPLPVLPFIFDEFGLLADNKEIVGFVKKLAAAGRKVGMYGCFAAQTWNSSEISTVVRANLATSIQFYARSKSESRILLGDSVAAEITRPGEAYTSLPGVVGLVQMQAPFLDEPFTPSKRDASAVEIELPKPEPTEEEARVLALYAKGTSYREITTEVWGQHGKFYNDKVEAILEKFGQL